MKKQGSTPNSFYRLGGLEILSLAQDERSKLWKIYLSTTEHYLVSREFDRSVGLYANAPDDIIRQGLMDFSDSIAGSQLSLFAIMDMFIDRCFDESVFATTDVDNAVWLSMDNPTYAEIEEIFNTYNCRLKWSSPFIEDDCAMLADFVNKAIYRTPEGENARKLSEDMNAEFKNRRITSVFMNHDGLVERLLSNRSFAEMPVFMGRFSNDGEFMRFDYFGH